MGWVVYVEEDGERKYARGGGNKLTPYKHKAQEFEQQSDTSHVLEVLKLMKPSSVEIGVEER